MMNRIEDGRAIVPVPSKAAIPQSHRRLGSDACSRDRFASGRSAGRCCPVCLTPAGGVGGLRYRLSPESGCPLPSTINSDSLLLLYPPHLHTRVFATNVDGETDLPDGGTELPLRPSNNLLGTPSSRCERSRHGSLILPSASACIPSTGRS